MSPNFLETKPNAFQLQPSLFIRDLLIDNLYRNLPKITGNHYKMSRNKDKYDSANRRQQIFLSQEDIAAGKKTNWSGLEITGMY